MAFFIISAALPWIGALIAFRSAAPRTIALDALIPWVEADENQRKGEFVVLVQGAEARENTGVDVESERILLILLKDLPVKQAAALAASITGLKKNALYQYALELKDK